MFQSIIIAVSSVTSLIDILSGAKACEGNKDDKFINLPNIHKGVLKNHSSKF